MWLSGVVLRGKGLTVAMDIECAFDESGTHAGSGTICLAGYVMERPSARRLEEDWNAVLNWKGLPRPLPYFHMADCAADPGNGVFKGLTKPQRIQVVSRLIGCIKQHTLYGFAVTLSVPDFQTIIGEGNPFYPDPYVLAFHGVLSGISKFIRANPGVGRVAYFFEQGHAASRHADALMRVASAPQFESDYHYAGHLFVPKLGNPIVQAADLLAWQWLKDRRNQQEGRPRRKDLDSLLIHPHAHTHIDKGTLANLASLKEKAIEALGGLLSLSDKVRSS